MASGSTIAQAYVKIIPTTKDVKSNIAKELSPQMDKESGVVGKAFGGNLVKTIGRVLAVAGIGKIIGNAISAGADLQQSIGGIETLFKDSADTMINYANEAYKTVGMSANKYMENVTGFSASLLQGLGGDTQKASEIANMAMIDMGDNANKMGSSMESIQNAYQGFAKQNYTIEQKCLMSAA